MKSPPLLKTLREIRSFVSFIHDWIIEENKQGRLKELERTVGILKGNDEVKEERFRAMEKYVGIEFVKENSYKKLKK